MDRILIFDFDGVLAQSLGVMLSCARQACLDLGYPRSPSQKDLEALERMEFTEFGLQLGIPKDKVEAFASRSLELFSSQADQLEITPGLDPVIRKLSQSANLSIVTGNSCRVVDKFLKANNLKGDFKTILCAEDSGSRVEKILKRGCG
jgi:phosphoglycolate phosphatase